MRVGDLTRQKLVTATIDLGDGDTVGVVFDRNCVTPAWVAEASRRDAEQDALSLPHALADIIVSWDVTNDDGTPFTPVTENLAVFSFPVQQKILTEIMRAAVPSDAEGKDSGPPPLNPSTASTQARPTSPNGTPTSTLPVPSVSPSLP